MRTLKSCFGKSSEAGNLKILEIIEEFSTCSEYAAKNCGCSKCRKCHEYGKKER